MDKENLPEENPLRERSSLNLRPRRTPAPFSEAEKNKVEEVPEEAVSEEEVTEEAVSKEATEDPAAENSAPQEMAESQEQKALEVPLENGEALEENGPEEASDSLQESEPAEAEKEASAVISDEDLTSENTKETEEKKEEPSSAVNTFDWIKSFLFSLTVVIFVFTLIFRGVTVNGGSMLPTLEDREYLIISDLLYTPKTGDIVVVQSPHYKNGTEPLIKRVIATGGQTVRINFTTWQVWVDGEELHEDYILFEEGSLMNFEDMQPNENGESEIVVEDNCIFVMGDHRNDSLDSRSDSVGQIDERFIMGRVLIRVTPFEKFGKVK